MPDINPNVTKYDVFLSYSSVDKTRVIKLKDDLLYYGVSVWLDKDEIRPGDIFAQALEEALDNCRAIALIVSPEAVKSGWVKEEYYRALNLKASVQLIPVILRGAELPGFLTSRNCVDFRDETIYIQNVERLVWGITGKRPTTKDMNFRPRIQVYWSPDYFVSLSPDVQLEAMNNFASKIKISQQNMGTYPKYKEDTAFELNIPFESIQQLRCLLESNDTNFRLLNIARVMLESQSGEPEIWFLKEGRYFHLTPAEGSKIINLFDRGLDTGLLIEHIRDSYKKADVSMLCNPEEAIKSCKEALEKLEEKKPSILSDKEVSLEEIQYSEGKFHLLLASIYLNQGKLRAAEENYDRSQKRFLSELHLQALTYLGLAITQRKLKKSEEALEICYKALESITHPSMAIPDHINTEALKQAIDDEVSRINKPSKPVVAVSHEPIRKKIFNIATGEKIVAEKAITDLNLLGQKDYESYERRSSKKLGSDADLEKFAHKVGVNVEEITYILEVPRGVKTDSTLQEGDRILISEEKDSEKLNKKKVTVLIVGNPEQDEKPYVALMTFFKAAGDHYFLQAESKNDASFIVTRYGTSERIIKKYYEKYKRGGTINHKVAFDIRISGEVKGIVRQGSAFALESDFNEESITPLDSEPIIWKIPVVSDISAGLGIITGKDVEKYLYLSSEESKGANFAVRVVGDSMKEDGILPGELALIRKQPIAEIGEIVAAVITTPIESLGVLKKFCRYEKKENIQHVWLASSNPLSKHIIVIPPGANKEEIHKFYEEETKTGRITNQITYYEEDAKIKIAGKYVGSRKND